MKVIDRHILFLLVRIFVLALASLSLLFLSLVILRYSTLISENNQALSAIVWVCIVGMPMHISFFVPIAAAIAAFSVLRLLHRDRALLGATALGYNSRSLRRQFLLFGCICAAVTLLFTLSLGPFSARAYYTRLYSLQADRILLYTEPKKFIRLTKNSTIWIEEKPSENTMRNIIFDAKSENVELLLTARYGRLIRTKGGVMLEAREGTIWRKEGDSRQVFEFEQILYGFEEMLTPARGWAGRLQRLWTRVEIPTSILLQRVTQANKAVISHKEGAQGYIDEYLARRELLLRFAYPLLSPIYVVLILAFGAPIPLRKKPKFHGLVVFITLLLYSTMHISAVVFSSRGGKYTAIVFMLSGAVFALALLLTHTRRLQ